MIFKSLELMVDSLSPFKSSIAVVEVKQGIFFYGDESKKFANLISKNTNYMRYCCVNKLKIYKVN